MSHGGNNGGTKAEGFIMKELLRVDKMCKCDLIKKKKPEGQQNHITVAMCHHNETLETNNEVRRCRSSPF